MPWQVAAEMLPELQKNASPTNLSSSVSLDCHTAACTCAEVLVGYFHAGLGDIIRIRGNLCEFLTSDAMLSPYVHQEFAQGTIFLKELKSFPDARSAGGFGYCGNLEVGSCYYFLHAM